MAAAWTYFRYGTDQHQIAKHWKPDAGTNRGCLIYVPGGGWSVTSERGFYEASVGKPVFTKIEANELVGGEEMVCISAMYALAYQDFPQSSGGMSKSWPAWETGGGDYSDDDYVFNGGSAYRCIDGHTPAAANEPGVGVDWEDYWLVPPPNDIGNRTEASGTQTALFHRCASKAGTFESGIRDIATLVQWVKQNATFLGIDPSKIVLMGDSAGGSTAGAVAYSYSREFSQATNRVDSEARDITGARKDLAYQSSGVSGTILEITPSDWRHFGQYTIQHGGYLMGIVGSGVGQQTEYDRLPASLKASLSPLGCLKATGNAIPTLLHYYGSTPGDGSDPGTPPWTSETPYHHAANGVLIEDELERLGQTNRPFYHDGNMPADIGQTQLDWLRSLWGYPLAS